MGDVGGEKTSAMFEVVGGVYDFSEVGSADVRGEGASASLVNEFRVGPIGALRCESTVALT